MSMSEEAPRIASASGLLFCVVSSRCIGGRPLTSGATPAEQKRGSHVPGRAFPERSRNSLLASPGALHRHRRLQKSHLIWSAPVPSDVARHCEPLKTAAALGAPVSLALHYWAASSPAGAATLARIDPLMSTIRQTVDVPNIRASSLAILRPASARVTSAWPAKAPLATREPKQGGTRTASGTRAGMPCIGRSWGCRGGSRNAHQLTPECSVVSSTGPSARRSLTQYNITSSHATSRSLCLHTTDHPRSHPS
jgi:hypothetical protein